MVEVMTKNQAKVFMELGLMKVEEKINGILDGFREKIMLMEEKVELVERRMNENEE